VKNRPPSTSVEDVSIGMFHFGYIFVQIVNKYRKQKSFTTKNDCFVYKS